MTRVSVLTPPRAAAVHTSSGVFVSTDAVADAFVMDEDDPAQCGALSSSLWEIKVSERKRKASSASGWGCVCVEDQTLEFTVSVGTLCLTLSDASVLVQTLQKHHHPGVSKAAGLINTPLLQQEEDMSETLDTTVYEVSPLPAPRTRPQDLHHVLGGLFTADGARIEADCGEERPAGV